MACAISFVCVYFIAPATWVAGLGAFAKPSDGSSDAHQSHGPADRLKDALQINFLPEKDWESLLSGVSDRDLQQVINEQPAKFWKSSPIAESAAFRIFGRLARSDSPAALTRAIETFSKHGIDATTGETCLRWAVTGIYENQPTTAIEPYFDQCPSELWGALAGGAVLGMDSGSISKDVQFYTALFTRLFDPKTHKEDKVARAKCLGSVLDAWTERDPLAVIAWLLTKEGEGVASFTMPKALAAATLGMDAEAAVKLMTDPRLNLKPATLGASCYLGGANAASLNELAEKMPAAQRAEFLKGFAKSLAEGSPRDVVEFVGAADASLLTPEVAKQLGQRVLEYATGLFDKLTAQMDEKGRNELLDDALTGTGPNETAAAFYLQKRGVTGPFSYYAIGAIARRDPQKAMALVATAPEDKRAEMTERVYTDRVNQMLDDHATFDDIIAFMKSAPKAAAEEVTGDTMRALMFHDSDKFLEMLDQHFANDPKVWKLAFLGLFGDGRYCVNTSQMDTFLQCEIQKGLDPALYSIAAQGLVTQYAMENINDARATVEALPDPKVKRDCTIALVKSWGWNDPFAAMSYVEQLSDASCRDAAIAELLPNLSFAPDKFEELLATASSDAVRATLRATVRAQLDAAKKRRGN